MPIHLRAEPGDYAPNVLCPGDPRRATYIAETFFDPGFRCVNEERGMLGFTGTFDGAPISVQTTGMGCPSAGIVFEELVHARRPAADAGRHVRRAQGRDADGRHGGGDQRHRRRPDAAADRPARLVRADGDVRVGRGGGAPEPRAAAPRCTSGRS